MTLDKKLLEILSCPVSKSAVMPIGTQSLETINASIADGQVKYVNGDLVDTPLEQGLMTEDRKVIYRIDDGIPVLLSDRGIGTAQFNDL